MRIGKILLAASLLMASVALAGQSIWLYEGSTVEMREEGSRVTILYKNPKEGLRRKPGDLIFEGEKNGSFLIGNAYIYQNCAPLTYHVTSIMTQEDGLLTLSGLAPIRDPKCNVISQVVDRLDFRFLETGSADNGIQGANQTGGQQLLNDTEQNKQIPGTEASSSKGNDDSKGQGWGWFPWWWYVGLILFPVVFAFIESNRKKVEFSLLGLGIGLALWLVGTLFYGMLWLLWHVTLGIFFDSVWDVPWWGWVVFILIGFFGGEKTLERIVETRDRKTYEYSDGSTETYIKKKKGFF